MSPRASGRANPGDAAASAGRASGTAPTTEGTGTGTTARGTGTGTTARAPGGTGPRSEASDTGTTGPRTEDAGTGTTQGAPDRTEPTTEGTGTTEGAPDRTVPATEGDAPGRPRGWPAWGDRAVLGLALVPLVVSAAALALGADGFHPTGDLATSELAVRDIGRAPVLTGLYSRADWSHPGPMLWYLLWPVYRVTGSTGLGLALGALLVNGGAVVGMAAMARRRGGTPLLLCTLVGVAVLVRSLDGGFTASYWNPHVTTLPFALLIMLVWGMACRDRWTLPAAAVVATFLAQTHVGFVPVALGLFAWGVVAEIVARLAETRHDHGAPEDGQPGDMRADRATSDARADGTRQRDGGGADRRDRRRRWAAAGALRPMATPAAVAVGALAVLWLPTVIDVLTNEPSNAGRTVAWFRAAEEGIHTLAAGWRVVSAQFALSGEWLVGRDDELSAFAGSPYVDGAGAPVLLAAAVAAGVALWRWSPRSGRNLVITLTAASAISVVAVARTIGPVFDYRLRWTWVVPTLAFVAVLWAAWLAATRRWAGAARGVALPSLVLALVVVTGIDAVAAARVDRLAPEDSDIMAPLVAGVLDEVERSGIDQDDEVLVADLPGAWTWFPAGVLVALDRHGYDARMPPDRRAQLGEQWVTGGDPAMELVVAADRVALGLLDGPGEVVAVWSAVPLDDDGRAALARTFAAEDALNDALVSGEVTEDEFVERSLELGREIPGHGDMRARLVVVVRTR